ncbi:MAG: nucleotidyltransferase [Gemmatimonadaceae bacterium]
MTLDKDLREFVELLLSRGVDFVVVGGHAVAYHGYPRLTDDLDLLVLRTPENAQKLVDALTDFGFASVGLTAADFQIDDRVIQLGRAPNRIDLITRLYGVEIAEVWSRRVEATLDGLSVWMISRDDLIRNKKATGRTQDLADAEHLEGKRP